MQIFSIHIELCYANTLTKSLTLPKNNNIFQIEQTPIKKYFQNEMLSTH
jgi:hypothetical protein